MSIRNQRLWIQGMPGESRVCGGCHESRTGDNGLGINQNPTARLDQGRRGVRHDADGDARRSIPGTLVVQPVHQAGQMRHAATTTRERQQAADVLHATSTDRTTGAMTTYNIPYLDFSATPLTVVYDRKVNTWIDVVRLGLLPGHARHDDGHGSP